MIKSAMTHLRRSVAVAVGLATVGLLTDAAYGEPTVYTWTGGGDTIGKLAPRAGNKVIGTARCATKEMTIDVTVDGPAVRGLLRQNPGPQYRFDTTRAANGAFSAEIPMINQKAAPSGGPAHAGLDDGLIHVRGVIRDGEAHLIVEGACVFRGTLTKK